MNAPRELAGSMTAQEPRAWMRLPSGKRLNLVCPDPMAWDDSDLAVRLSRTYRWGGESLGPVPMSVAQHSLQCVELLRLWRGGDLAPSEALRELLHDAEEGFLGFDCIAPLKQFLDFGFKAVTDRVTRAVWTRYRLPGWDAESHAEHKRADTAVAASEAVHVVGWSEDEVRTVLGIQAPILALDPLVARYSCRPWEPWPSHVAARRFLLELRELSRAAGS